FACKLGLAMHFEATGLPLPKEGGIVVRTFSNIQAIERKIPDSFLKIFSAPKTLRQGSWDVADQFQYSTAVVDKGAMAACFASYRFSFAVAKFRFSFAVATAVDRSVLTDRWPQIFSPGELWSRKA